MNITLEPLLSRDGLFEALKAGEFPLGRNQFGKLLSFLPYVLLPGQKRRRYRLSSALFYLASLPEMPGGVMREESLHRRRQGRAPKHDLLA